MKMADAEKSEELVNSKTPPETPLEVAAGDKTLKTETSPSEKEGDGLLQTDPGLLSAMPCLLMELRRDSPESQQASTESEKQTPSRTYESDSSNHCMLSPSSSGHLADSDTLSSAEENGAPRAGASCAAEGGDSNSGAGGVVVAGGRKSRRSRSESEMSSTTSMAAKKNRWQATGADKQNGRLAKVKGHRSQKHKERIRLLRQKREAAARKKYNLLQDSSTSDSDLTCDSSTSSSDDDKEVSGSGKTITGNIPAGFSRAEGSAGVTGQIQGLLDSGTSWDRNCIGNVLEEAMNRFAVMQRQTEERFRVWMDKLTRLDTDDETKPCSEPTEPQIQMIGQRVPPTTQSNACMQMSGSHLHSQAYVPYVVSHQNIDSESFQIPFNNNHPPTSFSENGNPASQDLDHSGI
ncbi:protein ARK2N-like isoform X2 [Acipenser ruthenus]|uniref:protein ARK2N-like isoform X2 n=1 Tax=Acipenser ruthenus TaxID=7906 RepID=UPI00145B3B30|nr:protein ARK2N-like isoform X2 [Acipenser ruthenus]